MDELKPCPGRSTSINNNTMSIVDGVEKMKQLTIEIVEYAEKVIRSRDAEIDRLRAALAVRDRILAPFTRHAASHDLGAPIRFSVDESRRIVGIMRGEG